MNLKFGRAHDFRLVDEYRTVLESMLAVFVVLKLTGVINWPWIYVLIPFWIPLAVGLFGFIMLIIYKYFYDGK